MKDIICRFSMHGHLHEKGFKLFSCCSSVASHLIYTDGQWRRNSGAWVLPPPPTLGGGGAEPPHISKRSIMIIIIYTIQHKSREADDS